MWQVATSIGLTFSFSYTFYLWLVSYILSKACQTWYGEKVNIWSFPIVSTLGDSIEESCEEILRHRPDFFTSFDVVVVASKLPGDALLRLSKILWENQIPLVVCWSIGFLGYLRIAVPVRTTFLSRQNAMSFCQSHFFFRFLWRQTISYDVS